MLLVADIVCHQLWAPVVQRAGWGTDGHELTRKVLGLQAGDGEEGCTPIPQAGPHAGAPSLATLQS